MIFTVAFRLLLPGDMQVLLEGGVSALPTTPLLWLIQPLSPRLLQVQLKLLLGPRRGLRVREPNKRLSSAEWAV